VRLLVGCPSCKRQFDGTGLAVGSRFRCRCGTAITIAEPASRDAAVVRCASCGAAREEGALACRYCGSDFTLHEQDLETICPSCLARISNTARFCHHCGTRIAPEEIAGDGTDRVCPACGEGRLLRSRPLGGSGFTTLECAVCAGLWIGAEVFRALEERARSSAPSVPDPAVLRAEVAARPRPRQAPGAFYRPCPACSGRMTRLNFERTSGILVDRCKEHGIWFDATELDAVLRWIRLGGERLSDERGRDEERARASHARFKVEPRVPKDGQASLAIGVDPSQDALDVLPTLLHWFLHR